MLDVSFYGQSQRSWKAGMSIPEKLWAWLRDFVGMSSVNMPKSSQEERNLMVRHQLTCRGITDQRVLKAMLTVPRDRFVGADVQQFAYADAPLPIAEEQTISQPYIVAYMAQKAEIKPNHRVLEVGTGSGYAAAILAQLADRVYTIERHARLLEGARQLFLDLDYGNIETRLGDGSQGWPEQAPFDAIVVSAAATAIPQPLCRQLAVGGRMVIPVGKDPGSQRLVKMVRTAPEKFLEEDLGGVQFVPLVQS